MFFTLKITPKHEMSNDVLWPPCGWRFSITAEAKLVISPGPAVEQTPGQRQMCGARPWCSIPLCWAPSRGASGELHSTARRKGHIPLSCQPLKARPHERGSTEMTTHCPCLLWSVWPGVVRKTEQTGKLQTTPAIQINRWKPVRTESRVVKKTDCLRCNAAFVSKTLPCKSI